jgi:hypothetical protein
MPCRQSLVTLDGRRGVSPDPFAAPSTPGRRFAALFRCPPQFAGDKPGRPELAETFLPAFGRIQVEQAALPTAASGVHTRICTARPCLLASHCLSLIPRTLLLSFCALAALSVLLRFLRSLHTAPTLCNYCCSPISFTFADLSSTYSYIPLAVKL